jgi:transposase
MIDLLIQQADGQLRFLDATHVKVHQDGSNPAGGQEQQSMGRTKGGLNTKLTALVDGRGRALQLTLSKGNMADVKAAEMIEIEAGKRVVADKGYDSDGLREKIAETGGNYCIPPRKTRLNHVHWHRGYYRKRHRVENFFQRIKRYRRVGTRYEKLELTYLAFVQLAAIVDWIKSDFANTP